MLFALFAATTIALSGQAVSTVFTFPSDANGQFPDGAAPVAGLVQAGNGHLYGTASSCGAGDRACSGKVWPGNGTIFEITPSGTVTTLHSFCVQPGLQPPCADGDEPEGGLVQGRDGNLYGTTLSGGVGNSVGTVFKITPSGTLTTLYSFCTAQHGNGSSDCPDGEGPSAGLVQGADGNFYGTTWLGGSGAGVGVGTVFKITPSGALTTLYNFCSLSGCADGAGPTAGLVQATDGNFYGTTSGQTNEGATGPGTIFKITSSGTLTTLYTFCAQTNCTDGETPTAGLVQASDGNLYGTTSAGGINGAGTVFRISLDGTFTTLYPFCSQLNCADNGNPVAALIQATDGNLYGTTPRNNRNSGTIFKITLSGTLTTLHTFRMNQGNVNPRAALVQDTNGSLYGTTKGTQDIGGSIFRLDVGLGPFVETQTSSGPVGAHVRILGTDLTGATSVTFNGVSAAYTVISYSQIIATVPAGATTGTVEVVTASGTLSSNAPFRVE